MRSITYARLLLAGTALCALSACADSTAPAPASPAVSRPLAASLAAGTPSLSTASLTTSDSAMTLLTCSVATPVRASRVIGPAGGYLTAGGHVLAVPAGAVPAPTTFTMSVPASPYVQVDIRASGAEHYQFARPVVISLSYSRCGSAVDALGGFRAWYIDGQTALFLGDMGGLDDRLSRRLLFTSDHLSGYAVAYRSDESSEITDGATTR